MSGAEVNDIAEALRCASRLVGAVFDIAPEAFTGPRKGPPAQVHARQVLCYLLHTDGEYDQAAISRALGRHRSTVGHAIEVIGELREVAEIDRAVGMLGQMYREIREAHARVPALIEEVAP